jgi:uncharacterized membrane protein
MTDDRMAGIIGNVLRIGVSVAAAVVAIGGVWYLSDGTSHAADYRHFHPWTRGLHSLASLPRPEALILVGLLILIATPVARVVFSLVAFAFEGDRVYVAITAIVLSALLYSIGTALW